VPHASILRVGVCILNFHDRSGQQTRTGNNETKSPTRKPDVWGTQIHLPTWCRATRRKTRRDSSRKIGAQNDIFALFSGACFAEQCGTP